MPSPNRRSVTYKFATDEPLAAAIGTDIGRFHDLRHTAATVMPSRGVHPKIVAERLGHSTPMLTLTVYSHVTPTMQRGAADEMDSLLAGVRS